MKKIFIIALCAVIFGILDIYIDNEIRVKCNGIHYDYQLP